MRIAAVLLVLSLIACSSPTDPLSLTVQGTVRAANDGVPIPGARVALVRQGEHYPHSTDVVADSQGRYSLSSAISRSECGTLRVSAAVQSWSNPNATPLPTRSLRCTSRVQKIDVQIRFEPF